ncbi:hypothetical protein Q1695_010256 [Nippostrongylus brasiliensis]|nr:hypothetical protein Q1695_010256 [Nippostrongylus brasiliensis]
MLRVNVNGAEKLHITLQCGDEQESVTLDRKEVDTMLKTLKDHVRDFADRAAPDWKEVFLFKQDTSAPDGLHRLHSASLLSNGCTVRLVVPNPEEWPACSHRLRVKTYMLPTFCHFCGDLIKGVIRQGLHCKTCKHDFHRRCMTTSRNSCAGSAANPESDPEATETKLELPHNMVAKTYTMPTNCAVCHKLLMGLINQGHRCTDCGVNAHRNCIDNLPANCELSENSVGRRNDRCGGAENEHTTHGPLYVIRR